jgi:hypothetical protein
MTEQQLIEAQKALPGFTPEYAGGLYGPTVGKGAFDEASLQYALQQLMGQGNLSKVPSPNELIFKSLSATPEQLAQATGTQYAELAKLLGDKLGYKLDEQMAIVSTTGGAPAVYTKDWKIVEFLLSQILDVETEQLETSIYNFPEGMQAFVPFSGYKAGMGGGGGGGGLGSLADIINLLNSLPNNNPNAVGQQGGVGGMPVGGYPYEPFTEYQQPRFPSTATRGRNFGASSQSGVPITETGSTFLDFLKQLFRNLATPGLEAGGLTIGQGIATPTALQQSALTDNARPIQTKLSLDLNNTLTVNLDGRVIAMVVSKYLGNSISRGSQSSGMPSWNIV